MSINKRQSIKPKDSKQSIHKKDEKKKNPIFKVKRMKTKMKMKMK